jgi:hypothetical protein
MAAVSPRATRWAFILGIATLCHGCGSSQEIPPQTTEQMQSESTSTLCNLAARSESGKEALLQELLRRRAIGYEHLAQIRGGEIAIGMSACETTAAWGLPQKFSSTPQIDYAGDPSIANVKMVYDYWMRARVYFGADGLAKTIVRKY